MSKKVKVLIVLSFIFLSLSLAAFAYDTVFITAISDVRNSGEGNIGEAVAVASLAVIFVVCTGVFVLLNTVNVVISGILIRLTEKGWRVYYIVVTSVSVLLTAAVFLYYGILQQ